MLRRAEHSANTVLHGTIGNGSQGAEIRRSCAQRHATRFANKEAARRRPMSLRYLRKIVGWGTRIRT